MKKLFFTAILVSGISSGAFASGSGFTCNGINLISYKGSVSSYASASDCWSAVASSRNGFTCNGIYLVSTQGEVSSFASEDDCWIAVGSSN